MCYRCPHCGWPDDEPFEVVSKLVTIGALTVWTRCCCGSLQVRVGGAARLRVVSRGQPA